MVADPFLAHPVRAEAEVRHGAVHQLLAGQPRLLCHRVQGVRHVLLYGPRADLAHRLGGAVLGQLDQQLLRPPGERLPDPPDPFRPDRGPGVVAPVRLPQPSQDLAAFLEAEAAGRGERDPEDLLVTGVPAGGHLDRPAREDPRVSGGPGMSRSVTERTSRSTRSSCSSPPSGPRLSFSCAQ
ncbi:hypothetical protein GCM10010466_27420 [Planomonospora alba]|uniref:Uncharacterized protein n=1 Tax=Planomonospora alba TaxID=161354 RepID=A0ABP6N3L2_9ACTN